MKMRVDPPREGVRAAIYGIETIGLTTGSSRNGRILTVGWQELSQVEVMDNAEVRIEWITSDPFSITVGSDFPHATTSSEKRRDQCIPASSY